MKQKVYNVFQCFEEYIFKKFIKCDVSLKREYMVKNEPYISVRNENERIPFIIFIPKSVIPRSQG